MKRKKYDSLKDIYPEYISLDQMYQICGIAKRSALYLIKSGIVPAEDTGKRTWRYKIALVDVITYLRRREQWGSMIPPGSMSSRGKRADKSGKPKPVRKCFADILCIGSENDLFDYFTFIYADYPDLLSVYEVSEMTGLTTKSVFSRIKNGDLKALVDNLKLMVPKESLLLYVSSWKFVESRCNSQHFQKVLNAFEIWIKRRSYDT